MPVFAVDSEEKEAFLLDGDFLFIVELVSEKEFRVKERFYLGEIALERIEKTSEIDFIIKGGMKRTYRLISEEELKKLFQVVIPRKTSMQSLEIVKVRSFFEERLDSWERTITNIFS